MRKSIYLCGFMGCGKSHVGKLLASRLNLSFVDLDHYIVEKEKRSIPKIFEQDGESFFRKLESQGLRSLKSGYVVATGGGALISVENSQYARENGLSVFIDTDFEICYERIKNDTNRPLVQKNTKEQLKALFENRKDIYKEHADYTVDGNQKDTLIVDAITLLAQNKEFE